MKKIYLSVLVLFPFCAFAQNNLGAANSSAGIADSTSIVSSFSPPPSLPSPSGCGVQIGAWTVKGATCSASLSPETSGQTEGVGADNGTTNGSASFLCSNNAWTLDTALQTPTCTYDAGPTGPTAGASCGAQIVTVQPTLAYPVYRNGTLTPAADGIEETVSLKRTTDGGSAGSALYMCDNGVWQGPE